jgi:Fe-S cluster biogenesis protein NfuA
LFNKAASFPMPGIEKAGFYCYYRGQGQYWFILYENRRCLQEFIMFEEQIKTALDNVRPSLQADGGDVEFVSVADDGTVSVKLTGACGGCPMAQMTLKMGIENYLKKEVPQVTSVVGI